MTSALRQPLAVTMGEPAGIGGELTLKTWAARGADTPAYVAIDNPERLERLAAALGLDVPVRPVAEPAEACRVFERALPVLPVDLSVTVRPGHPDAASAGAVMDSVDRAVGLVGDGRAAAMVTNPVQKNVLYEAGFAHPGLTEYLGEAAGGNCRPAMMLACRGLRAVPVTTHLPLADVAAALSRERIIEHGRTVAAALTTDFGIAAPRLTVAAFNPHAGEGGALGREEIEIIAPAVAELAALGFTVTGPAPADSLFHAEARERYDAVLCMYHDQALIPLKSIDFAGGVNVTLGLPFVRTSPDHGTALDIAGTGRADITSFRAALAMAAAIATNRRATVAADRVA